MPEYLKKRFGGSRIRIYLSLLSLIMYIFTKISADLYSGGKFLEEAVGLDIYISSIALLLLAMLFTVAGNWAIMLSSLLRLIGDRLVGSQVISGTR